MTQSSDVQGNINKIIIVKVKFILTFTIIFKVKAARIFSHAAFTLKICDSDSPEVFY